MQIQSIAIKMKFRCPRISRTMNLKRGSPVIRRALPERLLGGWIIKPPAEYARRKLFKNFAFLKNLKWSRGSGDIWEILKGNGPGHISYETFFIILAGIDCFYVGSLNFSKNHKLAESNRPRKLPWMNEVSNF